MKFPTLGLIGVVSAFSDFTSLPMYRTVKDQYCEHRIDYIQEQVSHHVTVEANSQSELLA